MSGMNISIDDTRYTRADRMRYEQNKLSADLAILAIVFNGLFFISIYRSDVGTYYYNMLLGASIVYNMLFMLFTFLVAEGSKKYHIAYSYGAIILGLLQFARIAVYPLKAHGASAVVLDQTLNVMSDAQYTRTVIYLIASGVSLIMSAVIGITRALTLKAHLRSLGAGKE